MVFHRVISESPPIVGVDVTGLTGDSLDQQQMFVRCNFPPPSELPKGFEVTIPGRQSRFVTTDQFRSLRDVRIDMVLECAGNGRTLMYPVPDGVPWKLGGVSPITVGGVRLSEALGALPKDVIELVFTGVDGYQFSIDRELYESKRPILATHIGDEPLDTRHGGPIRLIVPGHYAQKSVKSLTRVDGMTTRFRGYFVQKYRYHDDPDREEGSPVAEMAVRSIIASPEQGDHLPGDDIDVRGSAWTGSGEIESVVVSVDGGATWHEADLITRQTGGRFAPVRWAVTVPVSAGPTEIIARATDTSGDTQPIKPRYNLHGYGNNVVHRVTVTII